MLALSRKAGQQIVCESGENQIVVTVVRTGRSQVRLSIDAPKEVRVYRPDARNTRREK